MRTTACFVVLLPHILEESSLRLIIPMQVKDVGDLGNFDMQMLRIFLSLTVLGPSVFFSQAKNLPGRAGKSFEWEALPPALYDVSCLLPPSCITFLGCLHCMMKPFPGTHYVARSNDYLRMPTLIFSFWVARQSDLH